MGFFATYMGFIYNDFMSLPTRVFPSCYEIEGIHKPHKKTPPTQMKQKEDCVYPFGLDPAWMMSETDLTVYNSFKMKTSVILGVAHMLIGIVIKGMNSIYFDRKLDFYHEFIPQFLLLTCMFGYMDWMIVAKWTTDWSGREQQAPSIINKMILLFLNYGDPADENELDILPDQTILNKFMLLVIFVTPPWILFAKPMILKKQHETLVKEKESNGGDYEMRDVP